MFKNHIKAPDDLRLSYNTEQIVEFIAELNKQYAAKSPVFVVLNKVTAIDYGAITMLLSVLVKFRSNRVRFDGSFPDDKEVDKQLKQSGFIDALFDKDIGARCIYAIGKGNQFVTHGNKRVEPGIGLTIMEEASTTIWGERRKMTGLQTMLIELMHNTNNHAAGISGNSQYWWLSVNHDSANNRVGFVFMDLGIGIFENFKNKPAGNKWFGALEKIKNVFKTEKDSDVLRLLLRGEIHEVMKRTTTHERFRGKGLPNIKKVLDRNQVKNLVAITNNVVADVSKDIYSLINTPFAGTYYSWEIDVTNESLPWTLSN